jgi:hypothetical protein
MINEAGILHHPSTIEKIPVNYFALSSLGNHDFFEFSDHFGIRQYLWTGYSQVNVST